MAPARRRIEEKPAALVRTTVLEKIADDDDSGDDNEMQSVIVKQGDTHGQRAQDRRRGGLAGAVDQRSVRSMPGGLKLRAGQEVRLELAPAATDPSLKEPVKVSVFSGVKAEGTAERTEDGEYKRLRRSHSGRGHIRGR